MVLNKQLCHNNKWMSLESVIIHFFKNLPRNDEHHESIKIKCLKAQFLKISDGGNLARGIQ